MRDLNRIDAFCRRLAVCWKMFPDLRFGQFILNIFSSMSSEHKDPFFPEDDEMIKYIEKYTGVAKEK